MLLSLPNWIIHLFSSLEWGVAAWLLYRYGRLSGRRSISRFGMAMLPHWIGSFFVLSYHVSGDTIPMLLDLSEVVNLIGSTALLWATLRIFRETKGGGAVAMGALGAIVVAGKPQSWMGEDLFDLILQLSSVVYLAFLVLLVLVWRRDRSLFSGLTVAGFWFVLVFISVTVFFMYLATEVRGFPTLSHDDLLHGSAESLLSISNLLIALGAQRSIAGLKERQGAPQGRRSAR